MAKKKTGTKKVAKPDSTSAHAINVYSKIATLLVTMHKNIELLVAETRRITKKLDK